MGNIFNKRLILALTIILGTISLSGSNTRVVVEPRPQDDLVQSIHTLIELIDEAENMDNNVIK